MSPRHTSVVERALDGVARLILKFPFAVIGTFVTLALLGGISAARWLDLNTHQNALVSNNLDYNQRYLRYLEEFGDQEYIYLVVEVSSLDKAKEVAEAVALEMEPLLAAGVIERCIHRLPWTTLSRVGLLSLSVETLESLVALVEHEGVGLSDLMSAEGIPDLLRAFLAVNPDVARERPTLARAGLELLESLVSSIDAALLPERPPTAAELGVWGGSARALRALLGGLREESPRGPGLRDLVDRVRGQGYIVFDDLLLVLIMPQKNFGNLAPISGPLRAVKRAVQRVRERFPDVNMGLTGRPVLQTDEMEATSANMRQAAILALTSVLVLFMIFFRSVRRPLLTGLTLVVAIGITFGVITFTIGYLNLLSIVFTVMMVSLGTEFGIHITARYQEELNAAATPEGALRNTLTTAGVGNITGGLTTAAAFFTVVFTDFQGLVELGFIAGTGVTLCMILMNTLLPALLYVIDRERPQRRIPAPVRMTALAFVSRRPAWTLLLAGILAGAGLPLLFHVNFDTNLLNLQAPGLESVRYERRLVANPSFNTWFAVSLVDSLEEVRRLEESYLSESYREIVGGVESVLSLIPDDQRQKKELIRALAERLEIARRSPENGSESSSSDVDVADLIDALEALLDRLDFFLSGTLHDDGEGAEILAGLTDTIDGIIMRAVADRGRAAQRLAPLQDVWMGALAEGSKSLRVLLDPRPLSIDDLGTYLKERYRSERSGRFIIYVYPAKDIWKERNIEEFVRVTHEVDSEVTGVPEQIYQSTRIMFRAFLTAAIYSLLVVFLLVWLDFRSLTFALLAIAPVGMGLLFTFELMPILGMSFNLANFFSIPIIIGDGINGGVHMLHRYREDPTGPLLTGSTGSAVVLCSLTTIIGFGTLLLADHRGIAGLGSVMVVGSFGSLFGSVVVLPAILRILRRPKGPAASRGCE